MSTPTFLDEDVRRLLVEQIETMGGWKHSAHVFDGVETQGAAIGDRTFDVRAGESIPLRSDRAGADYLRTRFTIRIRNKRPPKQTPEDMLRFAKDRHFVKMRVRDRGFAIPTAIMVQWERTGEPTENVKGFLDTDVFILCEFWETTSRVSPDAGR